MSDLISRQEAIEKINERAREMFSLTPGYEHYLSALHDVETDLRHMPTIDAVPVVRCKDCKHNYANQIPSYDVCSKCVELPITADFFCKWGEIIKDV